MSFAASGSMVQKVTNECIWVCQKACWLKNELFCPRLYGTKRPLIENLIFGLRILHCDFWLT
ncbi:hypothetical protein CTK14_01995 [Salmonella enterica subsp. enterica serovar Typhimurium]|nr:hypothetical protein [Salmonella enterica]ECU9475108.1 hypothetical protein [Salmonella enterica subsp. enterica serovar Typhimurium]ECX5973497.1 hypothetical protein [Salmonella enterica subsp. enterica serovar Montevideo]EDL6074633.1 hypothetical protein [Salmonella enterica subsp. enterica serovar Typhimurium]EDL9353065.1 hypothetical protein [Salmonella enterica subsp. enterica serovar Typhimurium]